MCSSISSLSLSLPSTIPVILRHRFNFPGNAAYSPRINPSHFSVSASIAEKNSRIKVSWISWDNIAIDDYNGWGNEESASEPVKKKGLRTMTVIAVGTSVALLAFCSFSNKGYGFRLRSRFSTSHGISAPSSTIIDDAKNEEASPDVLFADAPENLDDVPDAYVVKGTSFHTMKEEKLDHIIVPFAVDSAQQEALLALKTLKISEDYVKADELCTRREYARWLVRANSQLERRRKHRINTSAALSGSRIAAFSDVGIEDPDFEYIQSLAEAGVVRSKLSDRNCSLNSDVGDEGGFEFFPDRFISREAMISWKAKIEYNLTPGINEEMSRKKIGFLDVKEISSDALVELFVDTLNDEKSIIRGVFGQSKRLQPSKPCTNGQAAVAVISGRMTEFVHAEISRLEAETISRQNEMEEIMSELLERGEIEQYWARKMEDEKNRGAEVKIDHHSATVALEQEKYFQENVFSAVMTKQKAALDCQAKLLSCLKDEVNDISEKLNFERGEYVDEQIAVRDMRSDLQVKLEELFDKKSILEAEVEALRILRSWVENEATKSQARAKLLEEAARRWKWDS